MALTRPGSAEPPRRAEAAQRPTLVAAASDLSFALTEIADRFHTTGAGRVSIVFGSSGTLTRQIRNGAPFDLLLSADEAFVDDLHMRGLTRDRGALYAIGRIVVFAPGGSPLVPDGELAGVTRLLDARRLTRFAIANPEHAPYGRAAEEALRARGLWDRIAPHLVLGDNVSQAAQFATTGNAAGGILAYSLALAPPLQDRGTYALIPEADHRPLRHRMVLTRRAGPAAERFYRYLQGPDARTVLQRFGFGPPQAE